MPALVEGKHEFCAIDCQMNVVKSKSLEMGFESEGTWLTQHWLAQRTRYTRWRPSNELLSKREWGANRETAITPGTPARSRHLGSALGA